MSDKKDSVDVNKLSACHNSYIKKDLKESCDINVLYFSKMEFVHTGVVFPNYIIGVTKQNDTIGCLDHILESDIKIGQSIRIIPYEWSVLDKDYLKIPINVNPKYFQLFCQLKTVYYCKFEIIKK